MLFLSCLLCFLACLFVDALWSPVGKGLNLWALVFDVLLWRCHFPIGILGQVWCLIVSIPDLCPLSYFYNGPSFTIISLTAKSGKFIINLQY